MTLPAYNNKGNTISILGKNKEALDYHSQSTVIEPNCAR